MNVTLRPRHGSIDQRAARSCEVRAIPRVDTDGSGHAGLASVLLVTFLAGLLVLPPPILVVVGAALGVVLIRVRREVAERPVLTLATPAVRFAIASLALWVSALAPFASQPFRRDGAVLLVTFAVLPVVAFAGCAIPRRRHVGLLMWVASVVGASVAGVSGLLEVAVGGARRADGMTRNAIVFGDLSLLMAMLTVALAPLARTAATHPRPDRRFRRVVGRWRELTTAGATLGIVAGIVSGARGGWLAMPVMAAVLVARHRGALRGLGPARIGAGAMAMAAVVVRLSGSMPIDRARAAVTEVRAYDAAESPFDPAAGTSIGARFEAWRAALWAAREHLLTGVGWGNLHRQFGELAWARYRNPRIAEFEHAHHQLISVAANSGLPGVVAWCAVMAVPGRFFWRSAWHSDDPEARSLGAAGLLVVSGYLVFGLTEAIFEQVVPLTFFAIVVALLVSQLEAPASGRREVTRE